LAADLSDAFLLPCGRPSRLSLAAFCTGSDLTTGWLVCVSWSGNALIQKSVIDLWPVSRLELGYLYLIVFLGVLVDWFRQLGLQRASVGAELMKI